VLILCVGCYSWRTIPAHEIPKRIEAGDKVRVTTTHGEQTVFDVKTIRPDSISGERGTFSLAEIKTLELYRFSVVKSSLAAGGYVLLLAVVSAAAAVAVVFG